MPSQVNLKAEALVALLACFGWLHELVGGALRAPRRQSLPLVAPFRGDPRVMGASRGA
jgi:hypothetical protein